MIQVFASPAVVLGTSTLTLLGGWLFGRRSALAELPMRAYFVGECDVVAARTPEEALRVVEYLDGLDHMTLDDVAQVTDDVLGYKIPTERGDPELTLGELLRLQTRAGWIAGTRNAFY